MSTQFYQAADALTIDPRYQELEREAERIAQRAAHNITLESAKIMTGLIKRIGEVHDGLGSSDCEKDAKEKLNRMKTDTLIEFGQCELRIKVEEKTWVLARKANKIVREIRQAAEETLCFCMSKNILDNVICRINQKDETAKRFVSLKVKIHELSAEAEKIHYYYFMPFANNCYDEGRFNSSIREIQTTCPP